MYSSDLLKISEEKLLQEFASQKVISVQRVKKKVGDIFIPTPLLILTFELLRLPDIITAAWHKITVKTYIPLPMRCCYCHMSGHTNISCRRKSSDVKAICIIALKKSMAYATKMQCALTAMKMILQI